MSDGQRVAASAAAMRESFDQSFAAPHPPAAPPEVDLLVARIGAEPYALHLSEIAALFAARKITPLYGSGVPALLGIAGFRGAIVPVYDMAALLGHPPTSTVRWLAMAAAEPVAFALAAFDGHRRVAPEAIVAQAEGVISREHVRDFVRTTDLILPIADLSSVLATIRRRVSSPTHRQEP